MKLNDTTINAITLRDVFAAVALHGLLNTIAKNVGIASLIDKERQRHLQHHCNSYNSQVEGEDVAEIIATEAYAQADAMLAKRNIKED